MAKITKYGCRISTGDDARRADSGQSPPEPLTDTEHADRVRHIRAELGEAKDHGLATDQRFFDQSENRWRTERQMVHRDMHEESSHVAYLLAARALKDGKNIIWDITMSKTPSVEQRLDDLGQAGFATTGVFVDIGLDEAVKRADARHRRGHEEYRAGIGFGGRYVPPEVIRAQADSEWGSRNRRTFEQVKARFTDWAVYDNSVTGRDPQLIQTG